MRVCNNANCVRCGGCGGSQVECNPLKLLVHGIDFSVCRSTEGVVGETNMSL